MSSVLPLRVLQARPLVHCMTNFVTMDWVARGLLAAGARPIMARDRLEASAVAASADALVLNLGTWSPELQTAMLAAGRAANARGIPVVLDPVGAGGLESRTQAALELLESVRIAAVRGNAGEVAALAGQPGGVRGVDTRQLDSRMTAVRAHRATAIAARRVAARFGCVVAATGEVDLVTDGDRTLAVRAGDPMMAQIPGTGCLASALVAAALAVRTSDSTPVTTVAEGLLWAGMTGETASTTAQGPGSFAVSYLDRLAIAAELPEHRIAPPLEDRLSLYVIVSGTTPLNVVQAVLDAGVGTIQFREKSLPMADQITAALRIRDLCHAKGVLFLVNDRVDIALAVGADGVHLGQDDLSISFARQLLGPKAIIGGTCETQEETRLATEQGADYIATGPVYATLSKSDAGEPYGPAVVTSVSRATDLPVVGIGGIAIGHAAPVIRAGACGVSVISAVLSAPDPKTAARTLLDEVLKAKGDRDQ